MGGRNVEFIIENTESNPAVAIAKFHKLIDEDHVPILTGIYLSSELYAVAPVADAGKTPFVVSSAGADNVTQRQRSPYIIRTGYTSTIIAHPFGEYAYKTLGYKRIIIIASDYAYGWEVAGGFQKSFEEAGGKIVQKIWTPLGLTDYSDQMKSIRKDADAVLLAVVGQSEEIIPKQYNQFGPGLPLLANHTSFDESVLQKIGPYVEGGLSVSTYLVSLDTPGNKAFVNGLKAKGLEPDLPAANGYLSIQWIHKAIEAVHGNVENKEQLMAALRKVQVKDAPQGPVKLDAYGQAILNVYLRKVVKVGDRYENKLVHTFPAVSQFWTYSPEEFMEEPSYGKEYPPCRYCEASQ
jgi:branched-chain amino acid transport system substrate-binding protein